MESVTDVRKGPVYTFLVESVGPCILQAADRVRRDFQDTMRRTSKYLDLV